jgi:hypothetical protein
MIITTLALLTCLASQDSPALPSAQSGLVVLKELRRAIGNDVEQLKQAVQCVDAAQYPDGPRSTERNIDTGTTVVTEKTSYFLGRIRGNRTDIEGKLLGGEAITYKTTLKRDEQSGDYIYSLTVVTIEDIVQHLSFSVSSDTRLRKSIYDEGATPAFDSRATGGLSDLQMLAEDLMAARDIRARCSSPVTVQDLQEAYPDAAVSVFGTHRDGKPYPFSPTVLAVGSVQVSTETEGLSSTRTVKIVAHPAATFPYDFVARSGRSVEFKVDGDPSDRIKHLPVVKVSINDPWHKEYVVSSGKLAQPRAEDLRPWILSAR